jgi:hypothetical protein
MGPAGERPPAGTSDRLGGRIRCSDRAEVPPVWDTAERRPGATRKAAAEPPKAASAPAPVPTPAAKGGGLEVPRALSLPQGALPEHGAGTRAPSALSALPQLSASSAQPVTERTAPDAQHDRRLDGGISQAIDSKRVDINTASVEELNRLGGRFAKAIVAGRPYASIDELVSKRVITRTTFSQIKDQITAN